MGKSKPTVAVTIPCYNEAVTIEKVVADFRAALPDSKIYVFDNNSKDDSISLAKKAGAQVRRVFQQGKGHVVREIFSTIDADVIIMIDGDDTYFADDVDRFVDLVVNHAADMVVGDRLEKLSSGIMRSHRQFGNHLIVSGVNMLFRTRYRDVLSGYRAFSRRFVQQIPVLSSGFEIETEMTIQALKEGLNVVEIPVSYRSRPAGSHSKLHAFKDGYRIILTAVVLLRDHHPLRFFGGLGLFSFAVTALAAILRLTNYLDLTAFSNSLLAGVMLLFAPLGAIAFAIGIILNMIETRFREMKQILTRNKILDD